MQGICHNSSYQFLILGRVGRATGPSRRIYEDAQYYSLSKAYVDVWCVANWVLCLSETAASQFCHRSHEEW